MTTPKEIQAIFFDAGGTLLHVHPSVGGVYAQTAHRYGLVVPAERMERAFRQAWTECHNATAAGQDSQLHAVAWWQKVVFRTLDYLDEDVTNREAYFQELYELFARPEVWRLFPETMEVLQQLTQRGLKLGLISNWDNRLRPLLEGLGVLCCFQSVAISHEVGAEKPNPLIFQHALKNAEVAPGSALHVGDSYRDDVLGARNAGMRAMLLARDSSEPSFDSQIIRSLGELLPIVG